MPPRSVPESPAPPPAPEPTHRLTAQALYAERWRYVFRLLPAYGIWNREEARDVAQTVWVTVVARIETYDTATHKTPKAWLTGIVRRCAANHRRESKLRAVEVPVEDPAAQIAAPGLDPEEATLLRTLEQAIRDEDRREALVLQLRHGLTVQEIAAVQGVSEDVVERRLHMARNELKDEGEEKKSGAFLGFGSLEALAEALQPRKPIPDEEGERLWERVAEQVRRQETDGAGLQNEPLSPPSPSLPPLASVPALAPAAPGGVLTLTKGMFAVLLAGAFFGGAGTGAGGVLAWQAYEARRDALDRQGTHPPRWAAAITADSSVTAATVTSRTAAAGTSSSAAPSSPSTEAASSPAAASKESVAAAAGARARVRSSSEAPSGPGELAASHLWILRMRRAAQAGNFALVLALAEQHTRRFGEAHVSEREAERIGALRRLGRATDAEQQARTTATAHPEHRGAMERAMGHPLP